MKNVSKGLAAKNKWADSWAMRTNGKGVFLHTARREKVMGNGNSPGNAFDLGKNREF